MATPRVGSDGVVTTKGDLFVYDGSDLRRLPRGADNQFLTVDPNAGNPLGLIWRDLEAVDLPDRHRWFNLISNSETDDGSYATVEIGQNAQINLTFHFPADFGSLDSLEVFCIPLASVVDKSIWLTSNYAGAGEAKNANVQSDLTQLFTFTADQITKIDVASLFTNPDPDDAAGIQLDHRGINTSIRYLGLNMVYTPA